MHEKFDIWNELKSLHSRNFHVSHSILIHHGSTKIRYVRLKLIQPSISRLTDQEDRKQDFKLKVL